MCPLSRRRPRPLFDSYPFHSAHGQSVIAVDLAGYAADRDCKSPDALHCDPATHQCVACLNDDHCDATSLCAAGRRVPGCDGNHAQRRCLLQWTVRQYQQCPHNCGACAKGDNNTFGDPCFDTCKHLYLQASCQ